MEAVRTQLDEGVKIEIWFQDEARIGQKNKITRRWARRGTRPCAPQDLRTQWAYIFGAICPQKGEAIGLVLPRCDTEAMNLHLAEISAAVRQMAAGTQEQSGALQDINAAIEQMNRVTQENAAMVEESTATSRSLSQETSELSDLIGRFQVGEASTGREARGNAPRAVSPGQSRSSSTPQAARARGAVLASAR